MSKKHIGSSIDDFFKEEGIFDEAQTQAVKENIKGAHGRAPQDEPHPG